MLIDVSTSQMDDDGFQRLAVEAAAAEEQQAGEE